MTQSRSQQVSLQDTRKKRSGHIWTPLCCQANSDPFVVQSATNLLNIH